jgi:hypothetical protein
MIYKAFRILFLYIIFLSGNYDFLGKNQMNFLKKLILDFFCMKNTKFPNYEPILNIVLKLLILAIG